MKNLQNLKGAKTLNKQEQQTINGGGQGGGSVYCRCLGGGGEGDVPNCELCADLCDAIGQGYICVGGPEQ